MRIEEADKDKFKIWLATIPGQDVPANKNFIEAPEQKEKGVLFWYEHLLVEKIDETIITFLTDTYAQIKEIQQRKDENFPSKDVEGEFSIENNSSGLKKLADKGEKEKGKKPFIVKRPVFNVKKKTNR